MSGHMYDKSLYIDKWNHQFYGNEPRFNFGRSDGGDSVSTKDAIIAGALLVGLGLLVRHDDDPLSDDANRLKE